MLSPECQRLIREAAHASIKHVTPSDLSTDLQALANQCRVHEAKLDDETLLFAVVEVFCKQIETIKQEWQKRYEVLEEAQMRFADLTASVPGKTSH